MAKKSVYPTADMKSRAEKPSQLDERLKVEEAANMLMSAIRSARSIDISEEYESLLRDMEDTTFEFYRKIRKHRFR